jgi:hypothetical protein
MAKGRKQKFGEETQILTIRVPKSIPKEKLKQMRILVQKIALDQDQDPQLLKLLYDIMTNKMTFKEKLDENELQMVKKIEEVIKIE